MKQYTYISLFIICSCAGDPFIGGITESNYIDAGNDNAEVNPENNSLDVNLKESSSEAAQVIVDAGVDQNNLSDQSLSDQNNIPDNTATTAETSTNNIQDSASEDSGNVEETNSPCVPKTCLTLAVEANKVSACGTHWDGCGNYIQCPVCDTNINPHTSCGGSDVNPDGTLIPGSVGFCGGGCVRNSNSIETSRCVGISNKYIVAWVCSDSSLNPPENFGNDGCLNAKNSQPYPYQTPTNKWCCIK